MGKRSFHLFCLQELLYNMHIRQQSQDVAKSMHRTHSIKPSYSPRASLPACLSHREAHGSLLYAQLQLWKAYLSLSEFLVWDEKHSPFDHFILFFFWCNKLLKKPPPKGKACLTVAPNWHSLPDCLYNITVWVRVTSHEMCFSLCFVCYTLASARPAVTPWTPSKPKY